MPRQATGEIRWTSQGATVRLTLHGRERTTFALTACKTEQEAKARGDLLARLVVDFRRAGVLGSDEATKLLEMAAEAREGMLPGVLEVAGELCGGLVQAGTPTAPTFAVVARKWTSGELHRAHPDHVRAKDHAVDVSRLEVLSDVDAGGVRFGDIPVDRLTVAHAQAAMAALPERARRPATRRAYGQIIHRVLALAVWPLQLMQTSPLPKGFMPRAGKPPEYAFLYPSEDTQLLGTKVIPIERRVLFGFLAREGCRLSEALALQFKHIDLQNGTVTLERTKTGNGRTWALDRAVVEAIAAWRLRRQAGRDDLVFTGPGLDFDSAGLARRLRDDLRRAGVARTEILESVAGRKALRVHDLRGTFVTLALANGKTEAWVADRTGHESSQMINRYRRAARSATELGLGTLRPLDQALPELARIPPEFPAGSDTETEEENQVSGTTSKAEVAELADAVDSKSTALTGIPVQPRASVQKR